MINYTASSDNAKSYTIDRSKRNILIIGKGSTPNKNKIIMNPMTIKMAKHLYGENSDLCKAYIAAKEITGINNIYTVNCQLYTDFIGLIDSLIHYDFDFIVPLDIYMRDTFINPVTGKVTHFFAYYLERLGMTQNKTTLIMTDRESNLYESIDAYLSDMNKMYDTVFSNNSEILNKYGNNIAFVLNNLLDNKFAHVILAASLSVCNFDSYPDDIDIPTYFDIDYLDVTNKSFCFYKHHAIGKTTSIEQLNNMSLVNNIYKRILIDILIKHVVRKLDFSEFSGVLFNPYVKVQIDTKVKKTMDELNKYAFVSYTIKSISFVKTGIGVGTIMIDLSIVPFSTLETINIFMEV
jgi:hypothetical protein